MAFKPIDPKRDEYRRYLERGGIIESLTKIFVRILKERPQDPTQYLLQNLGDARLQADNIAYLQSELEDARSEIQRLTEIIRGINPDLLEQPSNNDSINTVNGSEIVGAKDEINSVHTPVEQTHTITEYSEVASQKEDMQNTLISGANVEVPVGSDTIQTEANSTAE